MSSTFSPITGMRECPLRTASEVAWPAVLSRFDPHHLGARHHDLARRGVAEFEHRLDHPALVVGHHTALLGQVDDLAQLDLGGERPVAEAAARCQRVADQDQQPADRGQQHRNRLQRNGRRQRDGVGVLAAEGARPDTDGHEAGHGHDRRGGDQAPLQAQVVVQEGHQQHRRGGLARDAQQHNEIDVARPFGHHPGQPQRARTFVADQFLDARQGHRADGGVDGREQAAQGDQRDRAEQRSESGHGSSKYRDLSSSRRSFSFWRSWW